MLKLKDAMSVLLKHSALIVHGAGMGKGAGNTDTNSLGYLERLQRVISQEIEPACSAVLPGDQRSDFGAVNWFGPIGLILCPTGDGSITYAEPRDAGTWLGTDGRREPKRPSPTVHSLERAILDRPPESYNELGLFGYEVMGIFYDRPLPCVYSVPESQVPARLAALGHPEIDDPRYPEAFSGTVTKAHLDMAFPGLTQYQLINGTLYLPDGTKVEVGEMYRDFD